MPSEKARSVACSTPTRTLNLSSDFDGARRVVIAAMCFPRNEAFRNAYVMRSEWADRLKAGAAFNLSSVDIQAFLDLPSRAELAAASETGIKHGTVAGDLLCLIYRDCQTNKPEPSMRSALAQYQDWSLGRKYGDGESLKYSDMQLRRYFAAAAPAAHLWAAFRTLRGRDDGGEAYGAAFSRGGMPYLLGLARAMQDFASTFVPKRTKPPKPVIALKDLLQIPDSFPPIAPDLRPL